MPRKSARTKEGALEQLKAKQRPEFEIKRIIPITETVSVLVQVNEEVGLNASDYRDAIIAKRNLTEPADINGLNSPEVKRIIERIQKREETIKSEQENLPEWMKNALSTGGFNVVKDVVFRVKKHYEDQHKLAFSLAILVSLVKNAKILVHGEEMPRERFYTFKNLNGFTIVELNPLFEAQTIKDGYFDDSEKNIALRDQDLPELPFRNPREAIEQQIAWLDTLQDQYPIFALQLNTLFNDSVERLAYYVYGVSPDMDENGFRPEYVGGDMENPVTAEGEAEEREVGDTSATL